MCMLILFPEHEPGNETIWRACRVKDEQLTKLIDGIEANSWSVGIKPHMALEIKQSDR